MVDQRRNVNIFISGFVWLGGVIADNGKFRCPEEENLLCLEGVPDTQKKIKSLLTALALRNWHQRQYWQFQIVCGLATYCATNSFINLPCSEEKQHVIRFGSRGAKGGLPGRREADSSLYVKNTIHI